MCILQSHIYWRSVDSEEINEQQIYIYHNLLLQETNLQKLYGNDKCIFISPFYGVFDYKKVL